MGNSPCSPLWVACCFTALIDRLVPPDNKWASISGDFSEGKANKVPPPPSCHSVGKICWQGAMYTFAYGKVLFCRNLLLSIKFIEKTSTRQMLCSFENTQQIQHRFSLIFVLKTCHWLPVNSLNELLYWLGLHSSGYRCITFGTTAPQASMTFTSHNMMKIFLYWREFVCFLLCIVL